MNPHLNWRFRNNWRGKLVLQRRHQWRDDGHEMEQWKDATVSDMSAYYKENNNK